MIVGLYKIKKNLKFIDKNKHEQVFVNVKENDSSWADFFNKTFSNDNINTLAIPLDLAPLEMPKNFIIGALSKRKPTQWGLEITEKDYSESDTLHINKGATIYVPLTMNTRFIEEIRPDLKIKFSEKSPPKDVNRFTTINKEINGNYLFEIAIGELVPPTSSGIIGFIIRKDDLETRTSLLDFHDKYVTLLSNIERKATIKINALGLPSYNIHCYTQNAQYVVVAQETNGEAKVLRYISSTFLDLDDLIIEQIQQNN